MIRRALIALVLLAGLVPGAAAQVIVQTERGPRGYMGFTFRREAPAQRPDGSVLHLEVVDVMKDSPAARAGLAGGDVILRLNGLTATPVLLGSIAASVTPGDTVVLRVRRAGRERDVRVVAAPAPPGYFAATTIMPTLMPDSVHRRLNIIVDSMRASLDTTHVFRFLRRDTAGVFIFGDSVLRDSVIIRRYGRAVPGREFHFDTVFGRFPRDSALRMLPFDSTFYRRIEIRPGENLFEFDGNDHRLTVFGLGMRAIAGARLEPLNPELGRYFDRERGVLVLEVPQNTPARRAGLMAGDVILSADGTAVASVAELQRAIARAEGSVKLEIQRQRQRRTLELKK